MISLVLRSILGAGASMGRAAASGSLSLIKSAANPAGKLFDAAGGSSVPILSKAASKIGDYVRTREVGKTISPIKMSRNQNSKTSGSILSRVFHNKTNLETSSSPSSSEIAERVSNANAIAHAKNIDAAGGSDLDKQTAILSSMARDIEVIKENTRGGIDGGREGEGEGESNRTGFGALIIGAIAALAAKIFGLGEWIQKMPQFITEGLAALPSMIAKGVEVAKSVAGAATGAIDEYITSPLVSLATGGKESSLGGAIHTGVQKMKLFASDPLVGTSIGTNRGLEKIAGASLAHKVNSPELKELIASSPHIAKFANKHGVDKTANILNKTYVAGSSEFEIINELERLKDDPIATSQSPTTNSLSSQSTTNSLSSQSTTNNISTIEGMGSIIAPAGNEYSISSLLNAETEKAVAAMTPEIVVQVPPAPPPQIVSKPSGSTGAGKGGVGGGSSAPMIIRTQESTLQRLTDTQFSFGMP